MYLKIFSSCLTARIVLLVAVRSFPLTFLVVNGFKLTVQVNIDPNTLLFSDRAVGTMQVRAMHLNRPTIPSCLYYDSSNCVSSTLWFFYRRSSKTTLMYACDSFLLTPNPSRRGEQTPDQCFIRALSPQICKIWLLLVIDGAWKGLQTESSQQSGRPEWPNGALWTQKEKKTPPPFVCCVPLCFSLNPHALVLGVHLKRCFKKETKNN